MRVFWMMALLLAPALADVPKLEGRVNDFAGVLTQEQRAKLADKIKVVEELPGHPQIAIILPEDMGGQTIERYSHDVASAWKIGQAGKDNGVLVTIAPKERRWRIEVGYGLEGAIPDSRAKAIITAAMDPHLKGGKTNFYEALDATIEQLGSYIKAETDKKSQSVPSSDVEFPLAVMYIFYAGLGVGIVGFLCFLFVLYRRNHEKDVKPRRATRVVEPFKSKPRTSYKPKRSRTVDTVGAAAVGAAAASSSSTSRDYDSSSDSSSFSTSSSPSFSGGGGGFGGGGASGGD